MFTQAILGITLGLLLFTGSGFAAEQEEIGKFVKARIEISEMMMNYFSNGRSYGSDGQRPSPEAMREIGADINSKLSTLLATHDLTIEEYRQQSPKVFADDAAVKSYLNEHPDLKERYDALPLDRMGHGRSGRGY
jgi:type II secretory pathway pseudopilin PulG